MKSLNSIKSDVWQSFCVLAVLLTLPACLTLNFVLLMNNFTRWPFIIGYAIWAVIDMKRTSKSPWWCSKKKKWKHLDWFREGIKGYFGGAEIKFVNVDALKKIEGPMIFGCHPHGIFGLSPLINMAIRNDMDELLKCPIHVLTIQLSFWIPFWRDILVRFGLGPVDGSTCRETLRHAGHSIAVVIGGAREALNSRLGHYEIILKRRKGIFRIAVEEGKPIIPVFSFGDVDLYEQIVLPWPLSLLQRLSIHMTGFSMPFPSGRFGTILPFRRKLLMVVGRPVSVTGRTIEEVHAEYKSQLIEIFNRYEGQKNNLIIK